MGVPKFFRYISERYPCLSELVRENQIPEFDNLYLDMNGIIHVCSHPNDNDPHFRISEANIFKDIAHYIEVLFRMIQPQKLFFMAVDGVAPRAKMNQQRGRRFRSAKEAQDLEDAAKAKGEELPTEARFDSNCITPGTAFMARLQEYLKQFVKRKMKSDTNWQKCRVILSGHETPGEGEHKIMEYIRYLKASPGYDCNTRHCLYGLDADLIMLGLCSHEPHFSLLREEVKFGKQANNRQPTAEETRFYLLHLTLLRDYLEQEFCSVQKTLPFPYNLESIIDDWIFMGFLVGNDFIPHLPNLHINQNALPLLYDVYKEVLPTLDGYINEAGCLNLNRLEIFIEKLAKFDRAHFGEANADLKYFAAKRCDDAWLPEHKKSDQPENTIKNKELLDLVNAVDEMFLEDESPDTESDELLHLDIRDKNILNMTDEEILEEEFNIYKRDYYVNKLGYTTVTPAVLAEQAECYIRALQWTLMYYYRGVCSWGWFYPHHYAPFISDIRNFKHLDYTFNLGKPFLPFQQLLAVLPAASGALLPDPFRKLMVSSESPILHYYPTTFETDLNGKRQEWEAVVLIPFIEEDLLLKAMSQQEHLLSPEEISRNIHGPMLQYDYIMTSSVPDLTLDTPDPPKDFVQETKVNRSELYVPQDKLILGPVPGAKFDVYFPGFPTMKHLEYTSKLEKSKVRVFEQITRNDSMIIELSNKTKAIQTSELAKNILGKSIFVQWPHLIESKVLCVMDDKHRYKLNEKNLVCSEAHTEASRNEYHALRKSNYKHYYERLGIDISETNIIVQVLQLKNRVYIFGKQGRITLEKEWGSVPSFHPMQTCVCDLKVYNSQFVQYDTVDEVFTKFKQVYLLSRPYYGGRGIVYETEKSGRLKIGVFTSEEPNFEKAKQMHADDMNAYYNGYDAAAQIGISSYLLGRITGTIYIIPGSKSSDAPAPQNTFSKYNIGLNLKFTKKNEEVTGYSRRIGNTWYYSLEAIRLLRSYTFNFPEVFKALHQGNFNDSYYESDLYPNEVGTGKLEAILEWLKNKPHSEAMRKSCDSEAVTKDVVQEICNTLAIPVKSSKIVIALKPIHVFVPGLQPCGRAPDPQAVFKLFDRVVNVRPNHTVPLGAKGTVIGLHKSRDPNPIHQNVTEDIFLDVIFDESFEGGTKYAGIANKHCYRMNPTALINLTFGSETGVKVLVQTKSSHWNMNIENIPNVANNSSKQSRNSDNANNRSARNTSLNSALNTSQTLQSPMKTMIVTNSQRQEAKNASPAERKQFWDDLMKQKNVPSSPNTDTGTEALKQILGVTKNLDPVQNLSLKPEKPFPTGGAGCQNPPPITVQEMFKHARAASSGAPNLPPPPMQWYGPPNTNNSMSRVETNVQQSPANILMSGLLPASQPPMVMKQPPMVAKQPHPFVNHPPMVANQQPLVMNQPQMVANQQPHMVANQQPMVAIQQPLVMNQPQMVANQQPLVMNQSQMVANQQPIVINQPQQVMNQPQMVANPPMVMNQPQMVANQQPLVMNQTQMVANQQPIVINQPQQVMNQPHQVMNQPQPPVIPSITIVEKNLNKSSSGPPIDNTPPSAFIPLQAVKKGRLRNNSQTQMQDPEKPSTKEDLEDQIKSDVHQKRQEIQNKQVESQQSFQKFLLGDEPSSKSDENKSLVEKQTSKQKARKSRIAANFGVPLS